MGHPQHKRKQKESGENTDDSTIEENSNGGGSNGKQSKGKETKVE